MFSRTDTSILARWWWGIDRWLLSALVTLLFIGILLVFAASPAVATSLKLGTFFFVKRHFIYIFLGMGILFLTSCMNTDQIRKISLILFAGGIFFMILVPFLGTEIKGAKRWISILGFSMQPSEFMKPAFVILSAWAFAEQKQHHLEWGNKLSIGLYICFIALLLLQPDFGMVILVSTIWFGQFFLAGLSYLWILAGIVCGITGITTAYFFFPHVSKRIDRFLAPEQMDRFSEGYQISQSLEAITRGGLFGVGPGEGVVKNSLPDAHADFIFAVAAEEYGVILCMIIVALFAFVLIRAIRHAFRQESFFTMLSAVGLSCQFVLQALINISSTIHLIPTKGMTLPLISYGGSSILATCFGLGVILSLTRKKFEFGRLNR